MKHFLHLPKFKDDAYGTNTPDTLIGVGEIDVLAIQDTGQDPSNPTDISNVRNVHIYHGGNDGFYAQPGGINLTGIVAAIEGVGFVRVLDTWINIDNVVSINAIEGSAQIDEWGSTAYETQADVRFKSGFVYRIVFTADTFGKFISRLKTDIQL